MNRVLGVLAIMLMAALPAAAQVPESGRVKEGQSIDIKWPAAAVTADGLNTPSGYKVRATSQTQTGVVLREWDTAASARSLTIPGTSLPEGAFTITVHAFNSRGVAGSSNVVGPFGREAVPTTLTGVSGAVVSGAP